MVSVASTWQGLPCMTYSMTLGHGYSRRLSQTPFPLAFGPDLLLATLPGPQRQVQLMETAQNGIPNGPVAGTSCPTQKHAGVTWDLV